MNKKYLSVRVTNKEDFDMVKAKMYFCGLTNVVTCGEYWPLYADLKGSCNKMETAEKALLYIEEYLKR